MKKKIDGNQVLYQILKEEKVDLLKFIIESSFFSKKEHVENDKKNMIDNLLGNIPLFIRHKSAIKEVVKNLSNENHLKFPYL